MGLIGSLLGTTGEAAAEKMRLENMKKGKTYEQKKVIDFFLGEGGGCGCLGGGNKDLTLTDYLRMVQDKVDAMDFRSRAIAKIALDESQIQEIAPITMASFVFDDDVIVKVDGTTAVSTQYSVTWIFFSATQMYTYKYIFDMTSDNTWEFTNDFFYTDITCFSTTKEVKEKIDVSIVSGCMKSGENVSKSTYSIDRLEIIVPGSAYKFSVRDAASMEQTIQAAKAMLREKKYK